MTWGIATGEGLRRIPLVKVSMPFAPRSIPHAMMRALLVPQARSSSLAERVCLCHAVIALEAL